MSTAANDYEPLVKATLPFINNDRGLIIAASIGHDNKQERCLFITYSPGLLQVQGGAADGSETCTALGVDLGGIAALLTAARGSTAVEIMFYNRPTTQAVIYGMFNGVRAVLTFHGTPLTQKASVYIDQTGAMVKHDDAVLNELSHGNGNAVIRELPGGEDIPPNPFPKIPILKHEPPTADPESDQ